MTTIKASCDRSNTFLALIFLALLLRLAYLNLPFFEPYNSVGRQAVGAFVARNFYQHGFNFFYPEIDNNGAGPSLFNLEMQFNTYLAAIGYRLTGGPHEWVARAVSVFFSIGAIGVLYFLFKRLADRATALWATLFLAVSPLHLALSRSIQPEETVLLATSAALAGFYFYRETGRTRFFILSALGLFVAIGSKLYSVYLFIPITYLVLRSSGLKGLFSWQNLLYFAFTSSAALWWLFMWRTGQGQELAYSSYHVTVHRAGAGMTYFQTLFHPPYVKFILKIFLVHLLTPLGAVLFFAGFFQKIKTKADEFAYVWFWSAALYFFVFLRAAIQHPYYQAPFIPIAAFFVAKGARRIFADKPMGRFLKKPPVAAALIAIQIACMGYFYRGLYFIPKALHPIVDAGEMVQKKTPREALVIASHGTSAIQLYYCNRKGWSMGLLPGADAELIARLEKLRQKGAEYFMASSRSELEGVPGFLAYLRERYRVLEETPDTVLFQLISVPKMSTVKP